MAIRQRSEDLLAKRISFAMFRPHPGSVRLRPTGAGAGFVFLIVCGFLLSVNFSNNLIFAMTFLLAAIALISCYHTWLNLKGVTVSAWRGEPVFAGQPAVFTARLANREKRDRYGLSACSAHGGCSPEIRLAGGERLELVLTYPPCKRGLTPVSPAFIASRFPLGLAEARLYAGTLPAMPVYPKPEGCQPLPDQASGSPAHRNREAGTYTDMRRYTPGDPLSRISWRAFARFDELYAKEFDGAQGLPALWLNWELVRASAVEEKLSELCRWVVEAHRQNREFGLRLPDARVEPAGDETHYRRCLALLATCQFGEGRS